MLVGLRGVAYGTGLALAELAMVRAHSVFIGTPSLAVGSEIADWVRALGYEVELSSDGGFAVEALLHRGAFAASFLDIQLGAAEGQTAWRVVRPVVGRRLVLMARERTNELWFEALRCGVGSVLPLPPARPMVEAALTAVTAAWRDGSEGRGEEKSCRPSSP